MSRAGLKSCLVAVTLLAAACALAPVVGPAVARECSAVFAAARCEALAVAASDSRGIDPNRVVGIAILATPPPPDGQLDRSHGVDVRLTLDDGTTLDERVFCGGVSGASVPACMQEPSVRLSYIGGPGSGYRDIPVGSSPFPAIDASAAEAARPLVIDRRLIPVTAPGPARIILGQASLANGVVQEASIALADTWPDNVVLRGGVELEIRPAGGGAPIWNIYEHGWHEGTEPFEVSITFDAAIVRPGASLELVDVIVR